MKHYLVFATSQRTPRRRSEHIPSTCTEGLQPHLQASRIQGLGLRDRGSGFRVHSLGSQRLFDFSTATRRVRSARIAAWDQLLRIAWDIAAVSLPCAHFPKSGCPALVFAKPSASLLEGLLGLHPDLQGFRV